MPDNIVLNAGSGGATLSTDEVVRAGIVQHVQYVKLMTGVADATDVIPGDTTQGLDVDVTRLPSDTLVTGTLSAAGQAVGLNVDRGETSVGIQLTGTWTGTVVFEVTVDGTTWVAWQATDGTTLVSSATANGVWALPAGPFDQVRVRASAWTSGTATVTLKGCRGAAPTLLTSPLPGGANVIGRVRLRNPADTQDLGDATNPIRVDPTGTTTQPVSGTVTANAGTGTFTTDPTDRAARQLGRVFLRHPSDTANMGDATTPVRVDPTGTTTQPVSGTVTAAQGAPAAPSNRWPVFLSDGTAERGTAANPLRVDPTGTTTQPISGTVTATQGGAWTVTANAGTGTFTTQHSNVQADYDTGAGTQNVTMFGVALPAVGGAVPGGTAANPLRVDPTGTTPQPISGSVGLNAGSNLIGRVHLRNPADTANLGDAANPVRIDPTGTTTQPVSGTVNAQQAGTWTVLSGGSGRTLRRAVVALTASGDVIAAVPGRRLKVYQYALQSRADGMTCQFRDGAAGAFLGLRWGLNAREGAQSGPINPPDFLFGTSPGNALRAEVTGTGTVDIEISYWDDDPA